MDLNKNKRDTEIVKLDFGKQYTKLAEFDGNYFSEDLNFQGDRIYFVIPPDIQLLPSNVLLFELIWLSSQTSNKDYIVGWGAYPILNCDFEINAGKFKLPLINGKVDYSMNKFKDLEMKYKRNVDEWLCNLYIEVRKIDLTDFKEFR